MGPPFHYLMREGVAAKRDVPAGRAGCDAEGGGGGKRCRSADVAGDRRAWPAGVAVHSCSPSQVEEHQSDRTCKDSVPISTQRSGRIGDHGRPVPEPWQDGGARWQPRSCTADMPADEWERELGGSGERSRRVAVVWAREQQRERERGRDRSSRKFGLPAAGILAGKERREQEQRRDVK